MNSLRALIVFAILASHSAQLSASVNFFDEADAFFSGVVDNGRIKYAEVARDPEMLNKLVKQIAGFPLTDEISNRNKAFYINAYNILVIHQVVQHYPIGSPMDVPGFFDGQAYSVAGTDRTLNQLEKEILLPVYPDARIHFVLVCAAVDCPPIVDYAYMPDMLDKQLETQTIKALNDPEFIKVLDGQVNISEIFKWYKEDFLEESESVLDYINSFRKNKIPDSYSVSYYTYDWTLNDVQKKK